MTTASVTPPGRLGQLQDPGPVLLAWVVGGLILLSGVALLVK